MRRWIFFPLIVLVLLTGTDARATPIPSQVKEIVTFIFVRTPNGKLKPNGTGFFVGVKDDQNPEKMYGYLVTAKHVIQDKENGYYLSIFIRLNKLSGGAEFIEIPLKGKNAPSIFIHDDKDVDIAVLPVLPNKEIYEFKVLQEEMLTTLEIFRQMNIREGDEVFFTGLFPQFFGTNRNYPIVRFGRVAMITEEKVPWENKLLDLYLIESQSFGGNSGSPVFFYLGATRKPGVLVLGPPKLLLAGVMKGSFLGTLKLKKMQVSERRNIWVPMENAGIAAVVPAYKLYEILFSDELRELRSRNQ